VQSFRTRTREMIDLIFCNLFTSCSKGQYISIHSKVDLIDILLIYVNKTLLRCSYCSTNWGEYPIFISSAYLSQHFNVFCYTHGPEKGKEQNTITLKKLDKILTFITTKKIPTKC